MIPGGLTEARPATPEIQEIANKHLSYHHVWQAGEGEGQLCSAQHLPMHHQVPDHHSQLASTLLAPIPGMSFSTKLPSENKVKPQLEEKTNETYQEFEAVEYKTQVVAGINYYIKVRVGDNSYIHLKVFKGLPQQNPTLTLTGYQTDKSKDDEITGF
ncbi:cystatin-A isoform X1 [Ursus arctos]|uniref:cystatin-A isoform X1 n=1 Tax=Ursus arctos TaxID=9644 RepID=UPI002548317A|nr:cystatin-A isoform X1 [Ursus arctos]